MLSSSDLRSRIILPSKEEEEEGSQRRRSGSPGPAAASATEGEEALAAHCPQYTQLVLEGVVALRILLLLMIDDDHDHDGYMHF